MERMAESKIAEASKSNMEVVSDESEKSEGLRSLERWAEKSSQSPSMKWKRMGERAGVEE